MERVLYSGLKIVLEQTPINNIWVFGMGITCTWSGRGGDGWSDGEFIVTPYRSIYIF